MTLPPPAKPHVDPVRPARSETQRCIVISTAVDTWRRFRAQSRALPRGAWRRWWTTIAVGLVVCLPVVWALTRVAEHLEARGMLEWDTRVLRLIETRGPMSFQNAVLLESPGNLSYLIPLTTAAAIAFVRFGRPIHAASILAAYWLVRPLVLTGWKLWNRQRPDLIAEGIASPPLHSFPSGHIALAIAVYGFLAYLWIRASRSVVERVLVVILTTAFCLTVGTARVRLGTHWPSDVIGGAVIGIAWLFVVLLALRRAEGMPATAGSSDQRPVQA